MVGNQGESAGESEGNQRGISGESVGNQESAGIRESVSHLDL